MTTSGINFNSMIWLWKFSREELVYGMLENDDYLKWCGDVHHAVCARIGVSPY